MVEEEGSVSTMTSSIYPMSTTRLVENVTKNIAVGGAGGQLFDSGVNPSGLASIEVETGAYKQNYVNVIKRLHLTFRDGHTTKENIYWGISCHPQNNKSFHFPIDQHDSIESIHIWADEKLVCAVQFHTKAGITSPMFGAPPKKIEDSATVIKLDQPNENIVGIYGRFGGVVDKLGITTGQVAVNPPLDAANELTVVGSGQSDTSWVDEVEGGN